MHIELVQGTTRVDSDQVDFAVLAVNDSVIQSNWLTEDREWDLTLCCVVLDTALRLGCAMSEPVKTTFLTDADLLTPKGNILDKVHQWASWSPLWRLANQKGWREIHDFSTDALRQLLQVVTNVTITPADIKQVLGSLGYKTTPSNVAIAQRSLQRNWRDYSPDNFMKDEIIRAVNSSPDLARQDDVYNAEQW